MIEPTLKEVEDMGIVIGLEPARAEEWYYYYKAQGWKYPSGLAITDVYSALFRWRNNQYKFTKKGEVKVKQSKTKKDNEYSESFEVFWKKFKGRWNPENDTYTKVGKHKAFEEWEKLSIEDKRKAWKVADKVKGKYVPDAFRWLRDRGFDDFE